MEPNKFDKIIKEKMEARTIAPSNAAWDRLDAMLIIAEKPKRNYSWLFLAASFVGILIISSVFFNQKKIEAEKPNIEVVVKEVAAPNVIGKPTTILSQQLQEGTINNNSSNTSTNVASIISKSIKKEKVPVVLNQNSIIQVSIINQKSLGNLVAIQTDETSDNELLTSARNASAKENQLIAKQLVHVDVTNLLSQVDGELELSFREKVINKVSKNYQTVKVALSNRNFE